MEKNKCKEVYLNRIHKVQDYIENHIKEDFTIEDLAKAAGFSKYHFSRIFQGVLHESLAHYVYRIKMERALFDLAHRTDKNMTDIAFDLGYTDSAVFSRAFKNFFGVSPREYRNEYSKGDFLLSQYNKNVEKVQSTEDRFPVKGIITFENLEEKAMAYVRHTGAYEELYSEYGILLDKLLEFAKENNIAIDGENWILAMYHDNPEFGEESQFRTSICITLPKDFDFVEHGSIGKMNLEGGLYAVGHFCIKSCDYSGAWDYMYDKWLSQSGYMPRNASPFEVYRTRIDESGVQKVDIYVPVEPINFE